MCAVIPFAVRVLSTYRVVWRVPGEVEIDHLVVARDEHQARRISVGKLREAVGPGFVAWRIKRVM